MKKIYRFAAALLIPLYVTGCAKTDIPAPSDTQATSPTVQTSPTEPKPDLITGWVERDGDTFYYLEDGTFCTGWTEIEGITRWFSCDGRLGSGWLEQDGEQYYLNLDGSPAVGWLELGSDRYYFRENGTMVQGKLVLSPTETRYFASSGKEITLVNPWNSVPQDYRINLAYFQDWPVAQECLQPLEQMLSDCRNSGYDAVVVSAYRTHEYQASLYQRRIQRFLDQGYSQDEAQKAAAMRVAYPGTSEHELGLAVDIVDADYQKLTSQQESTPAQQWLMENCWQYGFILRYPNGKSQETGIIYEPWHYRYVGTELAAELYSLGLCLEEYFDWLTEA